MYPIGYDEIEFGLVYYFAYGIIEVNHEHFCKNGSTFFITNNMQHVYIRVLVAILVRGSKQGIRMYRMPTVEISTGTQQKYSADQCKTVIKQTKQYY